MTKFDLRTILKRWLRTGKRHIRGHKTKNKEDLTELTTSEESFITFDTSLSEILEANNFTVPP